MNFKVEDAHDFYRPIEIQRLVDSVRTEKGWKYNYRTLARGVLNSLDNNEFNFKSTVLEKAKVVIHNHDNQPLSIDEIRVSGNVHEIIARFTEAADYSLFYGNEKARKANYDIDHFTNKIPTSIKDLQLGTEKLIRKNNDSSVEPLFKNKIWLWTFMALIIAILGWFSLRMMNSIEK